MYIRSLEKMEQIVSSLKFLHWDGWTVVQTFPSEKARTSRKGIFRNGRWYLQRRFEPNENGWNIPEKLVSKKCKRESS
jgi:hypothetical protein